MKHILITVSVVAAFSFLTLGRATSQDVSCGQTAKELESTVSKINQDLDKAAFEKFVADDVIYHKRNWRNAKQEAANRGFYSTF